MAEVEKLVGTESPLEVGQKINEIIEKGGGGLEIGDIGIAPLGIDETKGKRRYLNGQVIIQEQFVKFTEHIKNRIQLYPSLACTEEEWQEIVTNSDFKQCGKFVIDDNAMTIRLPRVINIQGLTDLSKLGEIVKAGLPNITGWTNGEETSAGGAFAHEASVTGGCNNGSHKYEKINFDASRSSSIYGNSDTVQQEQIQYPYFIQVATGAETVDNITNEIELNNPYSLGDSKYSPVALNNLSWLKSEGQYNSKAVYPAYYDWALINANNGVEGFKFITDEYTDYDVVINSADETFRLPLLDGSEALPSDKYSDLSLDVSGSTYTAPANGWVVFSRTVANSQFISIANLTAGNIADIETSSGTQTPTVTIPVKKGDTYQVLYSGTGATNIFRFVYAQSNGDLYFYVGETVQNANLINAGRIQEKVAEAITRMDCKAYITETYVNGTSWYRIYSDGWCEQGGQANVISKSGGYSVTLLKGYKDTDYSVLLTGAYGATATYVVGAFEKSETTFKIVNNITDGKERLTTWEAKGYIA